MRFFFYGTLLDLEVTALVLGRRLSAAAYTPAVLPGWSRWRVQGGSYPIAVPDAKGVVAGAVVRGLSNRDVVRLTAYEGPGYRISVLKVRMFGVIANVSVFEPLASQLKPTRLPWDIVSWQRRDKRAFVGRLRKRLAGAR